MAVIADPKAIAARRNAGNKDANTNEIRQANLQRKKKAAQDAQSREWRKAHGLAD